MKRPGVLPIHIDTEFTSLCDPQLISIGAVTAGDERFYGVVEDFAHRACTGFVIAHVLPVLERHPPNVRGTFGDLARSFSGWLSELSGHGALPRLIVDDDCDIEMLQQLLRRAGWEEPDILGACVLRPMSAQDGVQDAFAAWFHCHPDARRHNALDDAMAYRHAIGCVERMA